MWPQQRAKNIADTLARIKARTKNRPLRFFFVPSNETDFINYFPKAMFASEFAALKPEGFEYIADGQDRSNCDVAIITAHGSDLSSALWNLRGMVPNTLLAVWLWDNHLSHTTNFKTALAADVVFPSHFYQSSYLINPASALLKHIPACTAQWTSDQARENFARLATRPRQSKLLANYVDYEFSWRSALLKRLKAEVPEAEVLLMQANDRSRYFKKTQTDRFAEWMEYKSSIVLPVDTDLSTRVFDALLAGQVLLVPKSIKDFDAVIPPVDQDRLGILRIPDVEIATIKNYASQALKIFDETGEAGVRERHEYVLAHHMLTHRIKAMLEDIAQAARAGTGPRFITDNTAPRGLLF